VIEMVDAVKNRAAVTQEASRRPVGASRSRSRIVRPDGQNEGFLDANATTAPTHVALARHWPGRQILDFPRESSMERRDGAA
jgi:hypothetical protein